MSAIITEQFRISNTLDFVDRVYSGRDSYYLFTGLSNSEEYSDSWDQNPPTFRDCLDEENKVWETMFSLKKISPSDVSPVIKKYEWQSGFVYDMYHHKINIDNPSFSSNSTSLYSSKFYVINRDFRVYICLYNGYDPLNRTGKPSLDEPTFVDLEPRSAGNSGDGYIWKYLYTISPSDILKFDSTNYIPVPINWFTSEQYKEVRDNASPFSGSGQIKIVLIKGNGTDVGDPGTYTNIPILGDGNGGEVAIVIGADRTVERIFVTSGGTGYTYGTIDLSNTNLNSSEVEFEVIIPPKGGHGADIYRELGPKNVLIYSRLENDIQDPDFIVGNKISRIGIIQNPKSYDSDSVLSKSRASAVGGLKIAIPDNENVTANPNSFFTQTLGAGVTAVGRVASYDRATGILKYWQDRTMVGFNTDGSPSSGYYGFKKNNFSSLEDINFESSTGSVDSSFSGNTLTINNNTYYLGQNYQNGLANPEVSPYSGEIVYIDNRPSINRSLNQREDIKIILQF